MTQDFAEFLNDTPDEPRTGPIFPLIGLRRQPCRGPAWMSCIVSRIGNFVGVKVNTSAAGKVKFASAHDLPRSFGTRWGPRVMPIMLRQLMRHESIDTTLRYYVGHDAVSMADTIWATAESTESGVVNSGVISTGGQETEGPQSLVG